MPSVNSPVSIEACRLACSLKTALANLVSVNSASSVALKFGRAVGVL